jgi:hypothetical protein
VRPVRRAGPPVSHHWAAMGHGRAVVAGRAMCTDGRPMPDKWQVEHCQGGASSRRCSACRRHWWTGYEIYAPAGAKVMAVVPPGVVWLCPVCRDLGPRGWIIIGPGRWKL